MRCEKMRAQLAEAHALLREIADHCNGYVMPTEHLLRDWGSSIDAALSASAEPSAPESTSEQVTLDLIQRTMQRRHKPAAPHYEWVMPRSDRGLRLPG